MKDIARRLAQLEDQAADTDGDYCACHDSWVHVDYRDGITELDDGPVAPIVCDRCGRPKRIIEVRLTTFAYGDGPDVLPTDEHGRVVFDYTRAVSAIAPDVPDGA